MIQKSHISISSVYTINSGVKKEDTSSAVMSYAIQMQNHPQSQIVSSLSILNDPSSSEKHDLKDVKVPSSDSVMMKTDK